MPIDGGPTLAEMGVDPASVAPAAEVNPAGPVAPVDPAAPPEPADPVLTPPVADAEPAADVDPGAIPASGSADAGPTATQSAGAAPENAPAADAATQEFLKRPRAEQLNEHFKYAMTILEKAGIKLEPSASTDASIALSENRRNLLASLKGIPKDNPEYDRAQAYYKEIGQDIQLVGENGEKGNLLDLQAELENPATTAERKTQIEGLISNGKYTTEFDDTRTPEEIADQSLDATIQFYEKRIKDAKEKDKNADVSADQEALDIATAAKGAKGYRAMFTAGAIRGLNSRLGKIQGAEGLILGDEAMARLAIGEQAATAEFLNDLHAYTGINPDRGLAMLDLARNGDFTELLKHPALKEMRIVNKLYGKEFKKPEDASKYVDQLLDLLEQEKYKKLKGMGIVGILMLAAAMSLKDMGANALSGGGGR